MKPNDELIERFRQRYQQEFNEEISRQQAYEKFLRMVNLLRVILRPNSNRNPGTTETGFSLTGFDDDVGGGKLN